MRSICDAIFYLLDPGCHAGYGIETDRPLLHAIPEWVFALHQAPMTKI